MTAVVAMSTEVELLGFAEKNRESAEYWEALAKQPEHCEGAQRERAERFAKLARETEGVYRLAARLAAVHLALREQVEAVHTENMALGALDRPRNRDGETVAQQMGEEA